MKKILLIFLALTLMLGCVPCTESPFLSDEESEKRTLRKMFEPPSSLFDGGTIDLVHSTDLSTIEGLSLTEAHNRYAEALVNFAYNVRGQIVQTTLDTDKKIFTYQMRLPASAKFASEPDTLDTAIRKFITKKETTE